MTYRFLKDCTQFAVNCTPLDSAALKEIYSYNVRRRKTFTPVIRHWCIAISVYEFLLVVRILPRTMKRDQGQTNPSATDRALVCQHLYFKAKCCRQLATPDSYPASRSTDGKVSHSDPMNAWLMDSYRANIKRRETAAEIGRDHHHLFDQIQR